MKAWKIVLIAAIGLQMIFVGAVSYAVDESLVSIRNDTDQSLEIELTCTGVAGTGHMPKAGVSPKGTIELTCRTAGMTKPSWIQGWYSDASGKKDILPLGGLTVVSPKNFAVKPNQDGKIEIFHIK